MSSTPTLPTLPLLAELTVADRSIDIKPQGTDHAHDATVIERVSIPASRTERIVTFIAVVLPIIGVITAMVLLWGPAFHWVYLAVTLAMYIITAGGITVGYHRYFTHKSFETVRPIQFLLGVAGSMACQGPMYRWAAYHRKHHQHSDDTEDPHSPHAYGSGVKGMLKGMWHAHTGWLFEKEPRGVSRYIVDLKKDKMYETISRLFPLWVAIGIILPGVVTGLVTMSWVGFGLGILWGGLVRVFLVHHVTWSINSVCHIWGGRPFESHDESRNNVIFGILALGEGWHNNHHAFPASARHGLFWWQFDASYVFIRTLKLLGLAKDIRLPTQERMEAKMAARANQK
ncbi:MAG: acyl-CoA desaturase [Phycisphaerales bacterium]